MSPTESRSCPACGSMANSVVETVPIERLAEVWDRIHVGAGPALSRYAAAAGQTGARS